MCTFNVTKIKSIFAGLSPFPKYNTPNLPFSSTQFILENVPLKFLATLSTNKWGLCLCPLNLELVLGLLQPRGQQGECREQSWSAMPLLSPLQEHVCLGPWAPGTVDDNAAGHQAVRKQSHMGRLHGDVQSQDMWTKMSSSPSIKLPLPPKSPQLEHSHRPSSTLADFLTHSLSCELKKMAVLRR